MQFTTLPGTGISVSRLCLGTMTFGSPVSEPDAIRLVHDAAELGVNFIDTANMYEGYNRFAGSAGGVAEEIVGKAVAGRRADFVVATKLGMKVGDTPVDENTSPEAIRVQLRRSLRRINTDYIDLYYLHRYDPNTAPGEIARAIGEELKAGTIRAWGVSNYSAEQLSALLAAAPRQGRTASCSARRPSPRPPRAQASRRPRPSWASSSRAFLLRGCLRAAAVRRDIFRSECRPAAPDRGSRRCLPARTAAEARPARRC